MVFSPTKNFKIAEKKINKEEQTRRRECSFIHMVYTEERKKPINIKNIFKEKVLAFYNDVENVKSILKKNLQQVKAGFSGEKTNRIRKLKICEDRLNSH